MRTLRLAPPVMAWGVAAALLIATHLGSVRPEARLSRHGINSIQAIEQYATRRAAEGRFLRSLIDEGLVAPDLVICVGGAGAVPYYTDWPTVDRRGLNDVFIARLPVVRRGRVGHERDAPHEYLVEREVAIFDVLNRIVHHSDDVRSRRPTVVREGHVLPLKAVKVRDHYLVFATTLSDDALEGRFAPGLEILHEPPTAAGSKPRNRTPMHRRRQER